MGAPADACLDHRWREQRRDVEHRGCPRDLLDRSRDCRVIEVRDDPHVGPQIAHEQHRLERPQVG
jgi:hypothetical protein